MTPAKAMELAQEIKRIFHNFQWERGTEKFNYRDNDHGYRMSILARSEGEAIRVFEHVLEIQGHAFNETHMTQGIPKKTYPVVPPIKEVYGKERRTRRERPITEVVFRKAELSLYDLTKNIVLLSNRSSDKPLIYL